uniref:Uncharacterized protein n=1 Tax=Isometrus maculatus TaxID=497827 RepID=A0A0U1S4N0_ISOMC|nr:hypothetical protein [Isometrus maculatus]
MSNLSIFVIMLLFSSLLNFSECQVHTKIMCSVSRECYEPCHGVTGRAHGKCMNKKCTCYW